MDVWNARKRHGCTGPWVFDVSLWPYVQSGMRQGASVRLMHVRRSGWLRIGRQVGCRSGWLRSRWKGDLAKAGLCDRRPSTFAATANRPRGAAAALLPLPGYRGTFAMQSGSLILIFIAAVEALPSRRLLGYTVTTTPGSPGQSFHQL